MISKRLKDHPEIKKDITPLYLSAFPEDERPPLKWFYIRESEHEENNIYGYYENDVFIGFTYLTTYKDICYIFFLAVTKHLRNKGYGSKILSLIKEQYRDSRILLCYEEVDKKYQDYERRSKRKQFYQRNGFKDNGLKTDEYGVIFETGYIGKEKISFSDYKEIFKLGFGPKAEKFLKEKI